MSGRNRIRMVCKTCRKKILSGVLKQKHVEVGRVEEGRRMIKDRLHHRKVLIVLDDVDNLEYLEELAGSRDWFGEGSRIIITTRDEHVLTGHKVDVIHNITLLNKDEAMKLFCKHAPRENRPMEDYKLLSNEVVSYAGGLPLALRVLGRFLCDKEMNEWGSTLDRLKEIPEANILEKLKISFDGLKPVERELFLDIACFYRGHHYKDEHIMITLEACGFHPVIGIKVLVQKALITISLDGRFDMHDLIEEMAHYIIRGEHHKNPAKHSRVWKEKDVRTICAMDATENLDKIEAIRVRCITCDRPRVLQVAAKMKKLRSIDLEMTGSEEPALPLMSDNFSPKELCCLTLSGLHAKQLWEGYKFLPNLRMIKLHNLLQTPHFDGLPKLERFIVYDSWKLKEIHPSFGHLEKLVSVWLRDCFDLTLPPITRSKKLETLKLSGCSKLFNSSKIQQNMNSLPHIMNQHIGQWFFSGCLRELDLSFCNLGDGDMTSDAVWVLPNLKEPNLERNRFVRLSFSLLGLPRLKLLNVSYNEGLVELSELPSAIAVVKWDYCPSLESFRDILNFKWLWKGSAKDYFISVNVSVNMWSIRRGQSEPWVNNIWSRQSEPWVERVKPYNMQLPHDWYNHFSGILMFIQARKSYSPHITIKLGFDLNFQPDLGLEDNGPVLESQDDDTFVGYVPFNSLMHTACLNSTYNFISFSIPYKERGGYGCLFRVVLVPKDDRMQTKEVATHSSQFWDEEDVYDRKTFTIQHDSNSSVKILWRPREL